MAFRNKNIRAFTLVEFAVVMLIIGILLVSGMNLYKIHAERYSRDETYTRLQDAKNAITEFYALTDPDDADFSDLIGRYPCPANPALPRDHPDYGREQCPPDTAVAGDVYNGVRVVEGLDTDLDPDTDPDLVLIGMLPHRTILDTAQLLVDRVMGNTETGDDTKARNLRMSLSSQTVYDGWGRHMTYAVTRSMTNRATFEKRAGAINLVDERNVNLVGKDTGARRDGVHYVVVSHGHNGFGAYTPNGTMPFACPAGTDDGENCNNDGTFIKPIIRTYAATEDLLDDIMVYHLNIESELWKSTSCLNSPDPDDRSCLYNTNSGFIGINTLAPQAKVDINGPVRMQASHSDRLCDRNGANCFEPGLIGGDGMMCGDSGDPGTIMVVRKIANRQVYCEEVARPNVVIPGMCPDDEFITGFNNAGGIICRPIPTP